ncbi:MAG: hypothetical protein IJL16_05920 [Clostridia bacterium]|nr:hypothetical protein [Clostridia bacterium]MBR6135377.1 hypothetical protein [Clostridia bacterium]
MIRQAIDYFRSKKISSLIILFIAVVYFVLSSVYGVYQSLIDETFKVLTGEYGSFDTVLFGVSDDTVNKYRTSAIVEKIGLVQNYGLYGCEDIQIILGSMDEYAMELVSSAVTEGRLPVKTGEIVFEECYKQSSEHLDLGNRIILIDRKGTEKEYEIVGFISSYSSLINGSIYPIPEKNGYPNALTVQTGSLEGTGILFVKVNRSDDKTISPDSTLIRMYNELVIPEHYDQNPEMIFNDQLFTDGVGMFIDPLKQHSRRDFTAFLIIVSVFLSTVFYVFFSDFRDICRIIYGVGATKIYICILYLLITLMLLIPGIILGDVILFIARLISSWPTDGSRHVWILIFSLIVIVCSILVFAVYRLYDEKLFFHRNRKRKRILKEGSMEWNSIRKNGVGFIAVILSVTTFLAAVISFGYERVSNRVFYGLDSSPWIMGDAYNTITFHNFGDFQVFPIEKSFSNEALDSLYELSGVKYIRKGYEHSGVNIVFMDVDSAYIDEYIKRNIKFGYGDFEDSSFIRNLKSSNNYSIAVISTHTDEDILIRNHISKEPLEEGKCFIFFPDIMEDPQISNDMGKLYKSGDNIRLASLVLRGGESDIYDLDSFDYVYRDIEIAESFTHGYMVRDKETGKYNDSDSLTIVMSESTFLELGIFKGISHFEIGLDDDITPDEYREIRHASLKITQSVSGAQFFDSEERRERIERIESTTSSSLLMLGVSAVICILFYCILMTLQSIQANSKAYGIMRALGMSRMKMLTCLMSEYLIYSALLLCIAIPGVLIYLRYYSINVMGIIMNSADYIKAMLPIFVISASHLFLQMLCGVISVNSYFRKSIVSNIRYKE